MTDVGASQFEPWPDSDVHVEWGSIGARLAAARGDGVVVVDVLSFSTTLNIAVERDFTCLVYSGAELEQMGGMAAAAHALGARPLSKSRRVPPGQISLSPRSLLEAEPGQRVLFTSLNGAAAAQAAAQAPALLVGGLRNAEACAAAVIRLRTHGLVGRVTVIACGEHWSSVAPGVDGVRPSIEDWLGAGLICRRLAEASLTLSAEAQAAAMAWTGPDQLWSCVSARELVSAGFQDDVALALQPDVSGVVPTRAPDEPTGRIFTGVRAADPVR
jgi:2-phosphosulfolactate phosphatase